MAASDNPRPFSLRRWSERKRAAARGDKVEPTADTPLASAATNTPAASDVPAMTPAQATSPNPTEPNPTPVPLPDIESLSIESDFSVFMRPEVDETLKRGALRKLFSDPHFNVMDGLDVYIDDYSKPDPIEPELVRQLVSARRIFAPPQMRITADGIAEDIPDEAQAQADSQSPGESSAPQANPAPALTGETPPTVCTGTPEIANNQR